MFRRLFNVRLRAQIVKELLSILRDPRSRLVLIGPPLIQLLVFSFAATLEVNHVDLAVYNRDTGRASYELLAEIGAAGFVNRVYAVHSPAQRRALIDREQVIAALDIPPDFSRNVAAGHTATAQVILDGRRANAAQITLGYLDRIAARTGAELVPDSPGARDPTVVRHWFNPNLIYRWYIVPSLSGILSTIIALIVTALSIARERELGTFDQLMVSPTTPFEIIVAKTVPAVLIGTVLGLVMIGAAVFVFGVPFRGSFGLLLPSLVLLILSMVGIGLMISAISSTQQQAILGAFAVAVPMVVMSGFATPVDNMPRVLQWVAECLPLTHFLVIVQGCFVKALPPGVVWGQAWPMAAVAVVTLGIAHVVVRSRLG
ncbi:ABC transporter permease [Salinisphaera hydrothermalis]|uniref:Transport permease protein n=1 Tax=Salinisphaera hydrothermalis (strain C41B8) TaxID=1304275 RepID=A0A084IKS5_SALHC|nr:ABC transporter permease [Salinisphaera hydrothermalis]KEZ77309.1 ABC transporter permease [Salinisphaera hydrothermalis C41B8]